MTRSLESFERIEARQWADSSPPALIRRRLRPILLAQGGEHSLSSDRSFRPAHRSPEASLDTRSR